MALSIVNTTSALPAHVFNSAPASLNGAQPQPSAASGNDATGDSVTSARTTDAVKPTARLAGTQLAGTKPVAAGPDARASVRFATNPVSTGPAAASASDYAKAIAAYTRQSVVGVAGPSSSDVTSGDATKGAAVHAASSHVDQANGGVQAHQSNVLQAAGSNSQATAPGAGNDIAATPNNEAAARTADATPPAAQLEAGGQAHPIAAPTSHAVMSLLKMI